MSRLTDLLKAGDVKYLQRDDWGNDAYSTVIIRVDVDNNDIREYTWWPSEARYTTFDLKDATCKTTELTLDEALADDWEIVELDV